MTAALRLVAVYCKLNLAAAMEYRTSFLAQCLGMVANDALLFFFWWIYFQRFRQVGGWTLLDLVSLYGLVAAAYGLATVVFGNCNRLATVISEGQLDYYLTLPKNPLLHVLVSRSSLAGWGDLAFGLGALAVAAWQGALPIPLAVIFLVTSTAIAVGYTTLIGSLAFFIGNAEAAAFQARDAMINFSLYPSPIFQGWTKVMLLTIVPAGFIAHLPIELMRTFDPWRMGLLLAFTAVLWAMVLIVFRMGLRRYESGNLLTLRG
jgi:ABC-2 type transport system permease protein